MCLQIALDTDRRIAYIKAVGHADCEATVAAMKDAAAAAAFTDDFGVLIDLSETDYVPSVAESRLLAQVESAVFGRRLVALVAGRPVQYGMGNMIARFSEMHGGRVEVFYDLAKGMGWVTNR